jgi:pimeloyl-ACP methyl ester carboxylesterase
MSQNVPHSEPAVAKANGLEIVYDTFGEASDPPMLFIMGLGQPMIAWDEEFCAAFAAQGYWVIRFDNRDVGLSTQFDGTGVPDLPALMQAVAQGQAAQVPYTLRDMAEDAVGLLDALGIESAHVVGASLGGMIAQEMAIHSPDRVRTLTSIMSTTGAPDLPPSKPEAMAVLLAPPPMDRAGYLEYSVQTWRVLNGPVLPLDEDFVRARAERTFDRGLRPAGTARQLAAVLTSPSRREALRSLQVPTLVIHGDADPLVPVEAGIDTAEAIPGAQLMVVEGMGHNIPVVVAPRIVGAIARHAASVETGA